MTDEHPAQPASASDTARDATADAEALAQAQVCSDALLAQLAELGIAQTTTEHPAVFTVDEARALRGRIAGEHTKNLFLKDKKGRLWLVVAREDAAVNLKTLRGQLGAATLSFGRPELLQSVLGVTPGSVTPFALVNDAERQVTLAMDERLLADAGATMNFHPLVNTRTTGLSAGDFLKFLQSLGIEPAKVAFDA